MCLRLDSMEKLMRSYFPNVSEIHNVKHSQQSESWRYDKDYAEQMEGKHGDDHWVLGGLSLLSRHFGWQMRSTRCALPTSQHEVRTWRKHCVIGREYEMKLASLRSQQQADLRRNKATEWRLMQRIRQKGRPRRWRMNTTEEDGFPNIIPIPAPPESPPSPKVPNTVRNMLNVYSAIDNSHGKRWNVKASAKNDTRPLKPIVFRM